jgi:putative metallohydrolase (TIGR04338 family)
MNMAPYPRDSQRQRVYNAERILLPLSVPLREVRDIERYITKNMARKAILRRYPDASRSVNVRDGRGTRRPMAYGTRSISIPLWARNESIVLHEMAHIIAERHFQGHASHGWQFCAVMLDLVRFCMGNEAHATLLASYNAHKVRYRAPRKRAPLTPEQRAALAQRLATARAAKAAANLN